MSKRRIRRFIPTLLICVTMILSVPLRGQYSADQGLSFNPSLETEYFSRTIAWDDDQYTSRLKALVLSFHTDLEVQKGLFLDLIFGYAFSNFNGLTFRQLPFSVEYQAGNIGGLFFGAEIRKSFMRTESIELEFGVRFVTCLGLKNSWDIEVLNVDGTLDGKPLWMRVTAGPVFWYRGLEYYVFPYVGVYFNMLWGTFSMDEVVEDLEGREEKDIKGKGLFDLRPGILFEPAENIGLKVEATIIPYHKGVDIGFTAKVVFSF